MATEVSGDSVWRGARRDGAIGRGPAVRPARCGARALRASGYAQRKARSIAGPIREEKTALVLILSNRMMAHAIRTIVAPYQEFITRIVPYVTLRCADDDGRINGGIVYVTVLVLHSYGTATVFAEVGTRTRTSTMGQSYEYCTSTGGRLQYAYEYSTTHST